MFSVVMEEQKECTKLPIDVVITWVDGNDSRHRAKMSPFLHEEFGVDLSSELPDDLAGETRFCSVGEIFYCVASIFRFAPFVRKIFVVTDGQDPNLTPFVRENFPNLEIPIEIVDHQVLFRDRGEFLPLFNSLSIETALYRIPGLSEHFVYFNDDLFLLRPVAPEDWFVNEAAVAYGRPMSLFLLRLLHRLKPARKGQKPFGFKDSIVNSTHYLPFPVRRCFKIDHTPHAMLRSVLNEYFESHPGAFIANASHRFRNPSQFNPQALFYMLSFPRGKAVPAPVRRELCLKPAGKGHRYIDRKKRESEQNPELKFMCINSLDQATAEEQMQVKEWLDSLYGVKMV